MIESIYAIELLNNERKKISERDPFFFFRFYRLICRMAASGNSLLDSSICSCFSGSYQSTGCKKIKWSTLSIGAALLIIVKELHR